MRRNALKRHGHRLVWWCAGAGASRGRNWPRLGWPEPVAARGLTSGRVGFARPDTWRCWPRTVAGGGRGWQGQERQWPAVPAATLYVGSQLAPAAQPRAELRLLLGTGWGALPLLCRTARRGSCAAGRRALIGASS